MEYATQEVYAQRVEGWAIATLGVLLAEPRRDGMSDEVWVESVAAPMVASLGRLAEMVTDTCGSDGRGYFADGLRSLAEALEETASFIEMED